MLKWKKLWNTRPTTFDKTDYFRQVGKTVHGQPISTHQFECMISEIRQRLKIQSDDSVLDLCCGNGIITRELAGHCKEVVGVDFSRPLIEIANRDHSGPNISYRCDSVFELDTIQPSLRFNKVLMYDASQYFRKSELVHILRKIVSVTTGARLILIGAVPHRGKKNNLYDTWGKRFHRLIRRITNKELIGTWWTEDDFIQACKPLALQCAFHDQGEGLYNREFRFDVTIS